MMRSRKRWVAAAALCAVVVVPEAHAQIGAPANSAPAGARTAVVPSMVAVQGAVARASRLESVTRQATLAQTAALSVGRRAASYAGRAGTSKPVASAGTSTATAAFGPQLTGAFGALPAPQQVAAQLAGMPAAMPAAMPAMPAAMPAAVPAAVPSGMNPAGVLVRMPARDFGSGYPTSYASRARLTSSARGYRAAATSPNGCLVIGDSIAARTALNLDELASAEFGEGCAYDLWNGRPTEGAVNALQDIARAHGLPKRVVMISGANDIFNPPSFRAQVERAAAIVGPKRTLMWASVFVRRPLTGTAAADLENSRWLNILLSRVGARHQNIHVVNWYGFLAARQRRLSAYLLDGVHPTPEGRAALAQLIADRW